jgi:hypothetical protein
VVLSQREKYVAIALGAVAAIAVLNWVVITPLMDWGKSIAEQNSKAGDQEQQDHRLRTRLKALNVIWQDMQKNGLKTDVSDAQNQVSNAVREWSEQSGVTLSDTKTGSSPTVDAKTGFARIDYQVTCAGTSSSIAKLLYQIESAKIPIRIDNIRVNSTKDGVDDLKAELSLSTLCVLPVAPSRSPAPARSVGA